MKPSLRYQRSRRRKCDRYNFPESAYFRLLNLSEFTHEKRPFLFNCIFELVEVGGELADEVIVPTVVVIQHLEFQLPRVVAVAEGGDGESPSTATLDRACCPPRCSLPPQSNGVNWQVETLAMT